MRITPYCNSMRPPPPCVVHRTFSHFLNGGPGFWGPMAGITSDKLLGRDFAARCAQTFPTEADVFCHDVTSTQVSD